MTKHPFESMEEVNLCMGELRYLVSRACELGVAIAADPSRFGGAETDALIHEWRKEWKEDMAHELDSN